VEQAGHTEVEQARITRGRDQNVGRLDIAMNDHVAVSVIDRFGHPDETLQDVIAVTLSSGPVVNAFAVDKLGGEKGPSLAGHSAVEQSGNAGMIEARKDGALGRKTLRKRRVVSFVEVQQFEG